MSHIDRNHGQSIAQALCFLLAGALYLFAAADAHANPPIVNLCTVYNNIVGASIARGAATLAVAALALGAMFGKVTWGMAILVVVGISALFGAGALAILAGGGC